MHYKKHIFVCTNVREGKKSCGGPEADAVCQILKEKARQLPDKKKIRISRAGCLGRCEEGPILVIYPEGQWVSYQNAKDLDGLDLSQDNQSSEGGEEGFF